MDEYSGKMDGDEQEKLPSNISRDARNKAEYRAHLSNRIGNSDRPSSMKNCQIMCSEKPRNSRTFLKSCRTGKEIIGSSSNSHSTVSSTRNAFLKSKIALSSHLEAYRSESSSCSDSDASTGGFDEQAVPEPLDSYGCITIGLNPDHGDTEIVEGTPVEVGRSSAPLTKRPWRNLVRRSILGSQDMLSGSSCSITTYQGPRTNSNANKYSFRNMKCNSISDVISSGCSPSDMRINQRKEIIKKRIPEGESSSSSSKGKKISLLNTGRNPMSTRGICISESRHSRNHQTSGDNNHMVSVQTQRPNNQSFGPSTWIPHQDNGNNSSLVLSSSTILNMTQSEAPIIIDDSILGHPDSVEHNSGCPNFLSRLGSDETIRSVTSARPPEITRSLRNRTGFRLYNIDGITGALMSLERIEQDEEQAYEQLPVLETNVLLDGLSFHDHHRDMRLDVDNMSYEELLALEERMGSVSTALTEEAVAGCLTRSVYTSIPMEDWVMSFDREGEVKCSICQEEYVTGEEVGRLHCHHRYHVECIQHWLRQKNWCPICKASAMQPPLS